MKLSQIGFLLTLMVLITTSACKRPCDGYNCANGGSRKIENKACACDCPTGFLGEKCEEDVCKGVVCQNGGTTVRAASDCSCKCPPGFTGSLCQINICEGVTCLNGGTKVVTGSDCFCDCPTGFVGDSCQIQLQLRYQGRFSGLQNCTKTNLATSYTIVVTPSNSNKLELTFSNIYNQNFLTNGIINPNGTVTIPQQAFGQNQISGIAYLNSTRDSIYVNFLVKTGSDNDACVAGFKKQ
jgi:hypothetical protein